MNDSRENFDPAQRDVKQKAEKIPLLFDTFEAAEEVAKDLIPRFHPYLVEARIKYICRNKATKRAGKPVPGNVYKVSSKFEFLIDCDFILEIALEVWNDLAVNQRKALIDHLLSRCIGEEVEESGEYKWRIIPPEVQEFPEVAARHGQWHDGLINLEKSLRT
jgi:hypothetical protein